VTPKITGSTENNSLTKKHPTPLTLPIRLRTAWVQSLYIFDVFGGTHTQYVAQEEDVQFSVGLILSGGYPYPILNNNHILLAGLSHQNFDLPIKKTIDV